MKGIILVGGTGSRLFPVTHVVNKNLLLIYNKPAIFYCIEMFRKAGIKDICIIGQHNYIEDFNYLIANGTEFGVHILYRNDSPIKKGPASALLYAKDFAKGHDTVVLFSDNNFDFDITNSIKNFKKGARLFLKEVVDPHRFGIAEIDKKGKVIGLEEKPEKPKTNLAATGLYLYDKDLFKYAEQVRPSINGEYLITDINNMYLAKGKLSASIVPGFWQDTGTFEGLFTASKYWYDKSHKE